jgi:hypothetical protein
MDPTLWPRYMQSLAQQPIGGVGRWLGSMLSPAEAEAKVRPLDERAAAVLETALAGPGMPERGDAPLIPDYSPGSQGDIAARYLRGEPPMLESPYRAQRSAPERDPFKQLLYQAIAQQAEREPAEVTVGFGMRGNPYDLGNYGHKSRSIMLSSGQLGHLPPHDPRVQDAFGHELVHFLLDQQQYPKEKQHPFIRYLLGTDMGDASSPALAMSSRPFTATAYPTGSPADAETLTPAVREALRRLLANTPLEHGVWQRPQ